MTDFVVKLLALLQGWIQKLPEFSIDSGVLSRIISSLDTVMDFVSVANFIIPLDHILIIMGLIFTVRSRKFLIACINWVIRRLADFFP